MDYLAFDRLCKAKNTSATSLALKLGLSKGNTSSWKNGGNPSAEVLIKIADELNCTVDLLLGRSSCSSDSEISELISFFTRLSEKDKIKVIERAQTLAELAAERAAQKAKEKKSADIAADEQHLAEQSIHSTQQENEISIAIKYFDYPASAGTGLFLDETKADTIYVRNCVEATSADFTIPILGDSMEDTFHSGDIVFVKSCPCVREGEIGIFVIDGSVYIKEYGGDCLISHNDRYSPINLKDYDTAFCLGRVLGKAQELS